MDCELIKEEKMIIVNDDMLKENLTCETCGRSDSLIDYGNHTYCLWCGAEHFKRR